MSFFVRTDVKLLHVLVFASIWVHVSQVWHERVWCLRVAIMGAR